jgi:hypothetical protein
MSRLKQFFSNWYAVAILLFLFCLAVQMFWLAAFFPGGMSTDSILLWQQSVVGSGYFNLQPYLYTFFLYHLRQIWDSPALVASIQITTSAVLASGFSTFLLRKGANKWLVVAGYLAFVFSVPVMITNIVILRDASYAALVMLLLIMFVTLFFNDNNDKIPTTKMVFIGLLLALIASFRYDGAIYLLLAPCLLYIFKLMNRKGVIIVLLTGLLGYFVIQVPIGNLLQIKENRYLQVYDLETEFIGQIYHDHPNTFSKNDIALMTKLTPLTTWENFDPTDDYDYWATYKIDNFSLPDFRKQWGKMFFEKIWANPFSIVKDRYDMTLSLLSGKNNGTIKIVPNELQLQQIPLTSPGIKNFFIQLFYLSHKNNFILFFFWSPFYLLVDVAFLTLAIIKKKKPLIVYILLGLASFIVLIPIVTCSQFRYVYPLFYSSFFVPALYTIKMTKDKRATGFYQK